MFVPKPVEPSELISAIASVAGSVRASLGGHSGLLAVSGKSMIEPVAEGRD